MMHDFEIENLHFAAPALLKACKAALGEESSNECRADHHGYCQAHGLQPVHECWVKLCEDAIRQAEGK